MHNRVLHLCSLSLAVVVSTGTSLYGFQAPGSLTELTVGGNPQLIDGLTDAEQALHRHWSQGVTDSNNMALILLRIMGPASIRDRWPEQTCQMLQIKDFDKANRLFVGLDEFARTARLQKPFLRSLLQLKARYPWSESGFEELSHLLKLNRPALDAIHANLHRDRYYLPVLKPASDSGMRDDTDTFETRTGWLAMVTLEFEEQCLQLCDLLCVRAMRSVHGNDTAAACGDLVAALHLATLLQNSGMAVIQREVVQVFANAHTGLRHMLLSDGLTPVQIRELNSRLNSLPKCVPVAEIVWEWDRHIVCDKMDEMRSSGSLDAVNLFDADQLPPFDWDMAAQARDRLYQEVLEVYAVPVSDGFVQSSKSFRERLGQIIAQDTAIVAKRSSEDRSVYVGEVSAALMMGDPHSTRRPAEFIQCIQRLTQVTIALQLFHSANEKYPHRLDELCLEYLESVPLDVVSPDPLSYTVHETGFELKSAGNAATFERPASGKAGSARNQPLPLAPRFTDQLLRVAVGGDESDE